MLGLSHIRRRELPPGLDAVSFQRDDEPMVVVNSALALKPAREAAKLALTKIKKPIVPATALLAASIGLEKAKNNPGPLISLVLFTGAMALAIWGLGLGPDAGPPQAGRSPTSAVSPPPRPTGPVLPSVQPSPTATESGEPMRPPSPTETTDPSGDRAPAGEGRQDGPMAEQPPPQRSTGEPDPPGPTGSPGDGQPPADEPPAEEPPDRNPQPEDEGCLASVHVDAGNLARADAELVCS